MQEANFLALPFKPYSLRRKPTLTTLESRLLSVAKTDGLVLTVFSTMSGLLPLTLPGEGERGAKRRTHGFKNGMEAHMRW